MVVYKAVDHCLQDVNRKYNSVKGYMNDLKELLEAELASLEAMLWTTPHLAREAYHIKELLRLRAEMNSECKCKQNCHGVA